MRKGSVISRSLASLLAVVLAFFVNGTAGPLKPFMGVAQGATITSPTAVASPVTPGGSSTVTVTFTPATAIANNAGVNLSFWAPPDSRFGVTGVSLGANTSSVFTGQGGGIQDRSSQWGNVRIGASSISASSLTIELTSLILAPKAGKYTVQIKTDQFGQPVDEGFASLQVGTVALSGTVTKPASAGGGVAANVWVNARGKTDFSKQFGSQTDQSGEYGIGGLETGQTYVVETFANNPDLTALGVTGADSVEITYAGSALVQNFVLKAATKTVTGVLRRQNGTAVSGGRVMAGRMDRPGFVNAQTASNGAYTLKMTGGNWEIRPDTYSDPNNPSGQIDYAYSGPGTPVKFAANEVAETKSDVNFTVVTASATITGTLNPAPTGFSGVGVFNRGGFGTGTGVVNGSFTVKVPPGSYEVGFFQDPSGGGSQYAIPPMDPITVNDGQTLNLGTINLVLKDKSIVAKVKIVNTATGLPGFEVGCFQPRGGGFSSSRTDANGNASVAVTAGKWGCMAFVGFGGKGGGPEGFWQKLRLVSQAVAAPSEAKYVIQGGPKFVEVTSRTDITFEAVEANRRITVQVTDSNGAAVSEHGFIEAELVGSSAGSDFDKGGGLGQPIDPNQPGMAALQVPAGRYNLRMMTPPGSNYSSGDPVEVDVTSVDASATIKLLLNDAAIAGTLKDEDGNTVKNTMVFVSASNKKGAFVPGDVDPVTGTYNMRVPSAGGELSLGYHVDPASGYFPQPFTNNTASPKAGETLGRDIVMKKATATVNFTVKDPDGNAIANAIVEADNRKAQKGEFVDSFFGHEDTTNASGQVTLRFPAGEYNFEAFYPPEKLRANNWLPPKVQRVVLNKGDTKDITLQFQKADVTIQGQVRDASNNVVSSAFVTIHSKDGEAIEATTNSNGEYSVKVVKGEWNVVAEKDQTQNNDTKPEPLISANNSFDTGASKSVTKNLVVSDQGTMSTPITTTFDTDNSKMVSVNDGEMKGAQVSVPQDALDIDNQGSNVTLQVESTVMVPRHLLDKPLNDMALNITAQDSTGQRVTDANSSNIAISIPVEQGDFTTAGYTITDVGKNVNMSYYDEENGKWTPLEGSVTAFLKDNTGDGDTNDAKDLVMVTGNTDHFTSFAVVASTDTTPPAAPTNIAASRGNQSATLSWTNPTDGDFSSITIYRSTTAGTLGTAVHTGVTGTSKQDTGLTNGTVYYYTVRAVDRSGNESTNTAQVNATPAVLPETGPASFSWLFQAWTASLSGVFGSLGR